MKPVCAEVLEPIGYDRAFYRGDAKQDENGWSHAVCLEDFYERKPAAVSRG